MELQPCPGCRRHVAEAACPFCGAAVERGERGALFGRLSRAAVFASATLIACGGGKKTTREPDDEAQTPPKKQVPERHHPCSHGDPDKIAELEKKKSEAKT